MKRLMRDWKPSEFFRWFVIIALLILAVGWCYGCGFAFISKKDLAETHENFQVYRANVKPTEQAEKVNLLGDLIEETLRLWKGDVKDDDEDSR